jgi:hypothetical protein
MFILDFFHGPSWAGTELATKLSPHFCACGKDSFLTSDNCCGSGRVQSPAVRLSETAPHATADVFFFLCLGGINGWLHFVMRLIITISILFFFLTRPFLSSWSGQTAGLMASSCGYEVTASHD